MNILKINNEISIQISTCREDISTTNTGPILFVDNSPVNKYQRTIIVELKSAIMKNFEDQADQLINFINNNVITSLLITSDDLTVLSISGENIDIILLRGEIQHIEESAQESHASLTFVITEKK